MLKLSKMRPQAITFDANVAELEETPLAYLLGTMPSWDTGLVVGGPPCQDFSGLNAQKKGFDDPRSGGTAMFAQLVAKLRKAAPQIA